MTKTVLVLSCLAAAALGRVIPVPDSAATIQAGLSAALRGDTVLVGPGTYYEHLMWPSVHDINLLSVAGPESTVVDGRHAGVCLVMNWADLKRSTLVSGFTFTNGYGPGGGPAGVLCAGDATIAGNRVTRCDGIGIYLDGYSPTFSPLITDNEVDGCFKEAENYNNGCGLFITGGPGTRPEVCYNYIHDDTLRNSARNYGGGIYCAAEALIYQNRIEANVLLSDTSSSCRAYGAGIYVEMNRQPVIFGNLITGNRCATDAWKYGAGIGMDVYAKPVIAGNTITGNVCEGPHMWSNGGGIYNNMACTTYVKNNIISANQATSGSGIYNYTTSQPGVVNSSHNDYYNNTLAGCSMGTGDIALDPLFVAGPKGRYYVSQVAAGQVQDSPCLDAGDTLLATWPLNLDSLFKTWTTRTDSIVDMLALDIGYHYPGGIPLGVAERRQTPGASQPAPETRPNPFRTAVTFTLRQRERIAVRVRVFDAQGRIVASLSCANSDRIHWNAGRLPAGVYVYRMTVAGIEYTGRLVKVE